MMRKIKTQPVDIARMRAKYSTDICNLVSSMLAKDPKQRPTMLTILSNPLLAAFAPSTPPSSEGTGGKPPTKHQVDGHQQLDAANRIQAQFRESFSKKQNCIINATPKVQASPRAQTPVSKPAAAAAVPIGVPSKVPRVHGMPSAQTPGGITPSPSTPAIPAKAPARSPANAPPHS